MSIKDLKERLTETEYVYVAIPSKEVIVEFEKDDGRVIVHHYVENSTEKIKSGLLNKSGFFVEIRCS